MVENASAGRTRTVTGGQLKNAKLSGVGKDRRRERKLKVKSLFHSAEHSNRDTWKKIVQSENSPQISECIVPFVIKKSVGIEQSSFKCPGLSVRTVTDTQK